MTAPRAGDRIAPTTAGPFDAATLDAYAAASGDSNPVHLDAAFARSVGQPDRIAHGMLAMGHVGRALAAWRSGAAVERFEGRFTHPVPIGASLEIDGRVASVEPREDHSKALVRLVGRLPKGKIVLVASAIVRLPN